VTGKVDAEKRCGEAMEEGVGDVEAAGETTAAATVGGNNDDNARPIGADTQVRVEGDVHPADN
jgi:hypothetical protein